MAVLRKTVLGALTGLLAGSVTVGALASDASASDPAAPGDATPQVSVPHLEDAAITLDGRLDEAVWQTAAVIENLTQHEPNPGEPTRYRTRILLFTDGENLYLGYDCQDPEPEKIVTHTLQRDGNAFGDDSVDFVLDTFGDRSTAYYFLLTAGGARVDGLLSPGSGFPSFDWDGSWDAEARRTPTGWSAEVVIPARILRFRRGGEGWGFNVARQIARDQLILRWRGYARDASFFDLRSAGRLDGTGAMDQGHGLGVAPFVVGRSVKHPGSSETEADAGLDVSYNLTPELAAVLTYRTDFAETEVDARQINLTRFPLFFPEKRTFFVEGANQLDFGYGLGTGFVPFFSRRIGLFQGHEVPIDTGLKLLGHAGPLSVGALAVRTRDVDDGPESTTLAAGRLALDVGTHWRVGTLFTDGDPNGVDDNSFAGFDLLYRTSTFRGDKNFAASLWGARSLETSEQGDRNGWGARVEYPNDLWELSLDLRQFGDALDPALGFLPRPGTRAYSLGSAYKPRPRPEGRFGWARQFFFESFVDVVTDLDGTTQSWQIFLAPFNVQTTSGDHFEVNVVPTYERLETPFEIGPGVVLQPGTYRFDRFRVQAEAAQSRRLRPAMTVWFGEFYDGHLTQWIPRLAWGSPQGHLSLEASAEYDQASLPGGDFDQRLFGLRVVWAATPDLVVSSFSQLDSDSDLVGSNTLLRWTIAPGRDLFVVFNKSWDRESGSSLSARDEQASIKLRWTFWR